MSFHLAPGAEGMRTRLFHIIFESDTPTAKGFDIALIVMIMASVGVILLGSVSDIAMQYGQLFLLPGVDVYDTFHPGAGGTHLLP